ncbi:MAG: N5-glutamine methyltransferase family protein, partial [Dehalococcoidia bacterium]
MMAAGGPPPPPAVKAGLTWDRLLLQAAGFLASQGVEDARLEAQSLLCYHLGWSRAELYVYCREKPAPEIEAGFWGLIRRRGRGEPTAYIQRHREFFGLDFYIDPRVFIPRPETELLMEEALRLAAGYPPAETLLLADIGTGSGAIAISLALKLPHAHIYATDVSPGALGVAALNCRRPRV